ncbi:MAG: TldD/PmbA family protein [Candidatus Lokiarchaeota archaeon]|nr:TldD/PmbA family protein [Candidatus Lokiarchaeota archaeon]MBD3340427.1 TldD/PmbA family protein [Candidatus Lokiarchaeota archaeon]
MEVVDKIKFVDQQLLKKLNELSGQKIQYWDLKAGIKYGTSLDFTDQKSKEISSFEIKECSIRTFRNGGWGFVVLKDLKKDHIMEGFSKAIKMAKLSESLTKTQFLIKERDPLIDTFKIKSKRTLESVDIDEKIQLVKNHEKKASEFSSKIKNTRTIYVDGISQSIFLNSHGSNVKQELSFLRLFNLVFAQENGVIQRAINSVGGMGGYEIAQTNKAEHLSSKTAQEAVSLLKAKSPIGGKFKIIMDPKLTGTFIHEAFGHAVEADAILRKESILEGKIGHKVADEKINIVDDPTLGQGKKYGLPYELFGSYFIDDEGIPSQKTTIIDNGVLKNYLHSLETSSRMNLAPNGHGRSESNTARPMVRMGITLLEPGEWKYEEIVEDTKKGVLCEDFQYGYCDPTTGNFQFKCKLSFKIENGEKGELMRDVALSGLTLEVLNRVSALGKEISYSDGMCGKGGQSVRVCDGGPYIRVDDVTVGGLS